jgi:hypothetical protein
LGFGVIFMMGVDAGETGVGVVVWQEFKTKAKVLLMRIVFMILEV